MSQRGRGEEAALGVNQRLALVTGAAEAQILLDGEAGQQPPAGVPGVDVGSGGGNHVGMPVARQVADHRPTWRLVWRRDDSQGGAREMIRGLGLDEGRNWPAGEL